MPAVSSVSRRTFLAGAAGAALTAKGAVFGQNQAAAEQGTIDVFRSMANGALVKQEPPGTTLVGTAPGLDIRPEGDVYIADRTAFFAALPFTLTTSSGTSELTLSTADYLDQEGLRENCVTWFDAADQRTVLLTDGDTVEEWADRVDPIRRARNDQYLDRRPTYVTSSASGADHPALRCDAPSAGNVFGLFFEASPVYYGLQTIYFESPTRLQVRIDDDMSTNTPFQSQNPFPTLTSPTPLDDQLNVFVGVWTKSGEFIARINGHEVASQNQWAGRIDYDGAGAVVFYGVPGTGTLRGAERLVGWASIANHFPWKGNEFTGDLFEWWSVIEVGTTPTPEWVLDTFDECVAEGTLEGSGPGRSAPHRLQTCRKLLVEAIGAAAQGRHGPALFRLTNLQRHIHVNGELEPSHFVTGPRAGDLNSAIDQFKREIEENV